MDQKIRGITIYYCGRERCEPGHSCGPAVRQHYLMHVILRGKGRYHVGGTVFQVKEGEAFLIRPQEVTYYKADEKDPWEYAWVAFAGPEGDYLLQEYGLTEHKYVGTLMENRQWQNWILCLVEAFGEKGGNQDEMTGYLYLLFSQMVKEKKADCSYHYEYLAKAEAYIHNNYSYQIRIGDIAGHVGIERTYLYKLFMKYKKVSPKRYLTAYRIMEAKRLLEQTALTVTEIGLSCGFRDSSVFCRNFLELEGQSPLQYRKNQPDPSEPLLFP